MRAVRSVVGLPSLSADALGLFRVVWGLALLWVLVGFAPDTAPENLTREYPWWGGWGWVDDLASNVGLVDAIETVTKVALCFFMVGLLSRLAYAVAAAGFTLYMLAIAEWGFGAHDWMPLTFVVPLLVFVRWGDGFSLDETIRRLRGRESPDRPRGPGYGMALWLPGLCLGLAWLSAAHAKISTYGSLEWAASGAVQYHWVIDAPGAPTKLGLVVASHEPLAVLLSFIGLGVEALFITHVLFRRQAFRALYLVPALSLLAGFWLFQGVFWTPWWVLLLVLIPWQAVYDALARALPVAVAVVDPDRPRCVARARLLHAVDWVNRVAFIDGARPPEGIQVENPETGTTYRGRRGWLRLVRSVPLLWPVIPILALAGARRLGERLAGRRKALPRWSGAPGPVRAVPPVGALVAVGAVFAQGAATWVAVEQPPFFSDFPMYSNTYPSRDYFDALTARSFDDYELRAVSPDGGTRDVTKRLSEDAAATLQGAADAAYNDRSNLAKNSVPLRAEFRPEVEQVRAEYREAYGEDLGPVQVVSINRPFLWDQGKFAKEETHLLVATVGTDEVTVNVPPDGVESQRAKR